MALNVDQRVSRSMCNIVFFVSNLLDEFFQQILGLLSEYVL